MSNGIKAIKDLGFPWTTQDPFLFCVYHEDHYPKGNGEMGPDADLSNRPLGNDFQKKDGYRMYHGSKVPGFPSHPHRGFETVTIVNKGFADHTDSMGAAGRFGNGDVQWMTAGAGVQHSEMFPLLDEESPNDLDLFQIWLNLPARDKMVRPHFKMLWREDIPVFTETDSAGNDSKIQLIAGTWNTNKAPDPAPNSWAANSDHDVAIYRISMAAQAELQLPKTAAHTNRSLYFYKGNEVFVNDTKFTYFKAIELESEAAITLKNGDQPSEFLVLQGKPINEPVVQYGPFVMNTEAEIQEAYADYQRTQWGGWPWPKHEYTHPKEQGRFALHADGTREER